jgi:WD40 repeat protein
MQVQKMQPDEYPKPYSKYNALPKASLQIGYVHGFRCGPNYPHAAKYLENDKILFIQAGLGVVLDPNTNTQQFFSAHDDDVISLAVHPDKKIAATGQMATVGKAKSIDCFVWSSETFKPLANNNQFHQREVNNLCFSPSGRFLLCTGRDNDNSLSVFDWKQKSLVCTSKVDKNKVSSVAWKSET